MGNIPTNEKGEPLLDGAFAVSEYKPPKEIIDLTYLAKKDYQIGINIQNSTREEFNGETFLSRINIDRKAFNAWTPNDSQEPDEAWRWLGVRPIVRNKILGISSHIIARMNVPNVFAQNEMDEEDKDAERVARTLLDFNIRNTEYPLAFLFGSIGGMVNPVGYFNISYDEAYQTIKLPNERGELQRMDVSDGELSGMHIRPTPCEEILITNAYEFYIQRQRAIIRRRFVDYDELEAKYRGHENFDFVRPGIRVLLDEGSNTFYNQADEELSTLGEEVIYYNRREDMEIPYVNGVYMGDSNPLDNRMKHRDNTNRPKYPYVKYGYHPIDDQRFYFYKSLAFEMGPDYELINEMHRLVMDRTFLEVMPPIGISGGADKIDRSVRMPGAITAFDKDTTINQLVKPSNLQAGYQAIREAEHSITETSQDSIREGVGGKGPQTAYEISRIEENARIQLGLFGKMIGEAVRDVGELMLDLIIHHQTVGEVEDLLAGNPKMKFRTFLLSDKDDSGKNITKKIVFDNDLIGKRVSEGEQLKRSYKILEEEGGIDANSRIYRVNPYIFARLKFHCFVDPEEQWPVSRAFQKILNLEGYDRMIQNPHLDAKTVTRDFLVSNYSKGDPDKYMSKDKKGAGMEDLMAGSKGKTSRLVESMTNQKALEEMGKKSI